MMQERVRALFALGGEEGAYILHKAENIRHYAGFTGEGLLVLSQDKQVLVTDFRYEEQAKRQAPDVDVVLSDNEHSHAQRVAQVVQGVLGPLRVEFDFVTIEQGEALRAALGQREIVNMAGLPEAQRMIKDAGEIDAIRRAADITDATFAWILGHVKVGMSELELADDMYAYMRRQGAEGLAFPSIVASGENSSLPHAEPSCRKIQEGDFLTLDFGAKWGGYCSDFTRTIAFGKVDAQLRKIYDVVLDAQLRALDALCAGKTGLEVDAVARGIIGDAGYADRFGHGLGHAVGRMIHEAPRLSPLGKTALEPGMVVTVEPGIYLPGLGGVRIEDLCVITPDGHTNLSHSTKAYIEL